MNKREKEKDEIISYLSSSKLSFFKGEVENLYKKEDVKEYLKRNHDKVVIFYPSLDSLLFPSSWASLFSFSKYLIIFTKDKENKYIKRFYSAVSNLVFSITRKNLCGSVIVENATECEGVLSSLLGDTVTINSNEVSS